MNTELMEALEVLEKEKNISKDTLLELTASQRKSTKGAIRISAKIPCLRQLSSR